MYDVEVHALKNCEVSEYTYYFNAFHGCERFCFKYDYTDNRRMNHSQ